ncbi:MAG: hypothetical protein H6747_09020 [Deltaproteobacteria bacterium]|nr:hypothetical protein [Deltaproteobacteria bacterium]
MSDQPAPAPQGTPGNNKASSSAVQLTAIVTTAAPDQAEHPAVTAWRALVASTKPGNDATPAALALYRQVRAAGLDEEAARQLLKFAALAADPQ